VRKQIHQHERAYNNAMNPKASADPEMAGSSSPAKNPQSLADKVSKGYETALGICDEKIMLGERAIELMNKHMKRLDEQIGLAAATVDDHGFVTQFDSDTDGPSGRSHSVLIIIRSGFIY
jgi:hypothetical protein